VSLRALRSPSPPLSNVVRYRLATPHTVRPYRAYAPEYAQLSDLGCRQFGSCLGLRPLRSNPIASVFFCFNLIFLHRCSVCFVYRFIFLLTSHPRLWCKTIRQGKNEFSFILVLMDIVPLSTTREYISGIFE